MDELGKLLQEFLNLKIKVACGFEFEFYLMNERGEFFENIENFIDLIKSFFISENFFAYIDKEKEIGQLEICSVATFDIIEMIEKWQTVLEKLKILLAEKNIFLNFKAKPFLNKAGNGLHINISLHDLENLQNLFGVNNNFRSDIKNELMAYGIGGLLKNIEQNLTQYLFNESTIARIKNPDRNTPTNFSCGQNNRTTMIRIPESLPPLKRIENRLPSAENDLHQMIFLTLQGIFEGINSKIEPPYCTYGLAFDEQYSFLKKII
jgi:glutamine synthetase